MLGIFLLRHVGMPLYVGTKVSQIMNQFEYQSYSCDTVLCFKKTSIFAEKAYLIKTALRLKYILYTQMSVFNIQYLKENISKQVSYNSKHIFRNLSTSFKKIL